MKNAALALLFILITGLSGLSQSLQLMTPAGAIIPNNSEIIQAGTPDSIELITYLHVKNVGSKSLSVLCSKLHIKSLDSTEATICWAGGCYPPFVNVSPFAQVMAPGTVNTEFVGHYAHSAFNKLPSGESIIRWTFYDQDNTSDSASIVVKYTSYPLGIAYAGAPVVTLSNPTPNPASHSTSVTYSLTGGSSGMLVVRNVVGKSVYQQDLLPGSGKVNIPVLSLPEGIYFCTLMVDGRSTETRKLIIRH